jgi:hypothetical protein
LLVPRLNVIDGHRSVVAPALELFLHLDSGVTSTTPEQLLGQLRRTGFGRPRRLVTRPSAELCLFVAEAV